MPTANAPISSNALRDQIRGALRSIIRDWQSLHAPLPLEEMDGDILSGKYRYRVRETSYEELVEHVTEFAGRVWQLKDGLSKWLEGVPGLEIAFFSPVTNRMEIRQSGSGARKAIEDYAKTSIPLLLCADLYNSYKHYEECNRSGFSPVLHGVQFCSSDGKAMPSGLRLDGARKLIDLRLENALEIRFRIEMVSRSQPLNFGDAVVMAGKAFNVWVTFIRQINFLQLNDKVDNILSDDLYGIEREVAQATAFPDDGGRGIDLSVMSEEERAQLWTDPSTFVASICAGPQIQLPPLH